MQLIKKDNSLTLKAEVEDAELLDKYLAEGIDDVTMLYELSDRYIGNGYYINQNIGLTEAPNICIGAVYSPMDDMDEPIDFEEIYWYPSYMITDWVQELIDNGEVTFFLAYKRIESEHVIELQKEIEKRMSTLDYHDLMIIDSFITYILEERMLDCSNSEFRTFLKNESKK